ncbi:hypothetical protein UlMin_016254 [Ulmus minor]
MGGATNRFFSLLTTTTTASASTLSLLHHHRRCYSSLIVPFLSLRRRTHFVPLSKSSQFACKFHSQAASSFQDHFPSLSSSSSWSKFLDSLSSAGFFNRNPGFGLEDEFVSVGDYPQDFTRAAAACLEFSRQRAGLLRLVSRRDVEVLVENGTPLIFKNGHDSATKLRSFLSENVLDADEASTVDLMRYILSYASNFLFPLENNNINNRELVESSVRNLLNELAKLCYTIPDSNSLGSVQSQFAGGSEQTPRSFGRKMEMKRGDWICPRCSFMNFARNIKCLECEEARPKRQLTGGEWECPQCDFFNYGRNTACLRCDCKRPGEVSLGTTNTRSGELHGNGNNPDKIDIDRRIAANEEKAQRWFSKISQLGNDNVIAEDDDFPEIMPLRKGVNRFVVSTRKTPLERRLASSQYQSNNSPSSIPSSVPPQYEQPQGSNSNHVPFVPLTADMFAKKPENLEAEKTGKTVTGSDESVSGSQESGKSEESIIEREEKEKSERWFKRVAELHNVSDLASSISDEDFPEIMPMRKGENRFVVGKKKDRSLTSPAYKRQMAMDQAASTKFVPFVPFPPDYFAKKDKPQTDGVDLANKAATLDSETSEKPQEKSDGVWKAGNLHVGSGSWNSQPCRESLSEKNSSKESLSNGRSRSETLSEKPNSEATSSQRSESWTGKSLEGSAVKEPDPLDMSEEAKAERWFRRVAQIKDISELSQIPDEDFPSIMPMRKGVNRFVVSKRKTPLERRLTSPQYRRNLPITSSDERNKENEDS